ncbi:MAG: PAS domain S-box protein [Actinomycetota bacterium]
MVAGLESGATGGVFTRAHRLLVVVLWGHVPVLGGAGLAVDQPVHEVALTSLTLMAFALTGMTIRSQRLASVAVTLGLLVASGIVVDYAGGSIGAHIHFFLAICAISFYQHAITLVVGVAAAGAYHIGSAVLSGEMAEAVSHTGGIAVLALLLAVGWRLTRDTDGGDRSGDRFRISFEEAPIGMAVLKPSGEILEANRAMASILGYDHASLVGVNINSLVHVDDKAELGEAWEEMGNSSSHTASEWMRCLTADGLLVWGKVSLSLVPRTDQHPAMVILQLEDANHPYEEQRRLEDLVRGKDELVAAVGGEIREPLGLLIDLTDAAGHSHVDTRDTLPRIGAHARNIASMVDDLVISARAGTAPISTAAQTLDAEQLCRELIAATPGAEGAAVDFRAHALWADPAMTRHIITNLLGNAVRYGGSSISVRTVSSGPDTVIQVTDNGPELPESERERMFSGDLARGAPVTNPAAVGLSLAVSRHLARQMDGDLVYRRTGDGENIFELRLPSEPLSEIPRRRGVMGGSVPAEPPLKRW